MTERWRLLDRLHTLAEIRDIMNSMKILALLESRKLARYLDNQQQALAVFDDAGADFLQFLVRPGPLWIGLSRCIWCSVPSGASMGISIFG